MTLTWVNPSSSFPMPSTNTSRSRPYAALTESRFRRIATRGMTIERKATARRTKLRPRTKAKTIRKPAGRQLPVVDRLGGLPCDERDGVERAEGLGHRLLSESLDRGERA